MNEVDTSAETINAEFAAAEAAIGTPEEQTQSEAQPNDGMNEADKAAQIAIAQQMIASTLRLSIGMLASVSVDNKYTDEAAHAYAVLIIKYFPGGLFGLLDKYKEELAAGTATFLLIRAVSQAKAEDEKKQQAEKEKQKKPRASEVGAFTFGEQSNDEKGNSTNG